jgi:hypothetical protein
VGQPQQFAHGFGGRKGRAILGDFAELPVVALDQVGSINQATDFGRVVEQRYYETLSVR